MSKIQIFYLGSIFHGLIWCACVQFRLQNSFIYIPIALSGFISEGTSPGLLPGDDQEHLGCGPGKRRPGWGALSETWGSGGDGTPISGWVHQGCRRGKGVALEKIRGWTKSVQVLSGVAHNHPQSAYAGLQKSHQQ